VVGLCFPGEHPPCQPELKINRKFSCRMARFSLASVAEERRQGDLVLQSAAGNRRVSYPLQSSRPGLQPRRGLEQGGGHHSTAGVADSDRSPKENSTRHHRLLR